MKLMLALRGRMQSQDGVPVPDEAASGVRAMVLGWLRGIGGESPIRWLPRGFAPVRSLADRLSQKWLVISAALARFWGPFVTIDAWLVEQWSSRWKPIDSG